MQAKAAAGAVWEDNLTKELGAASEEGHRGSLQKGKRRTNSGEIGKRHYELLGDKIEKTRRRRKHGREGVAESGWPSLEYYARHGKKYQHLCRHVELNIEPEIALK